MMKLLLFLLALLLALPAPGNAQRKRAFLTGISTYHANGRTAWINIHGKEDIDLLTPALKEKGFEVCAIVNEEATYKGIVTALNAFIDGSMKGDVVYLHFSCHGQPVEDGLNGYAIDEADGWDESVVPIDAGRIYGVNGYKGENHLTDDELNGYITTLRTKIGPDGMLFVAMDACHAGNMERDDFETIRGTNEGLTKNPRNKYNPTDHPKRSRPAQSPAFAPVVFIEACESSQRNQEVIFQNKDYGALSFNIFQMLGKTASFPKTVEEFKVRLSANITHNKVQRNGLWPAGQTVVFEY